MMIRKPVWITLCGGLAAIVAGEWLAGAGAASHIAPTALAMPHAAAPHVAEGPDVAVLSQEILARPLFAPTRRPPPAAVPPPRIVAGPTPPPQARLAGTITTATAHVAFFDAPPAKPVALDVGGNVGAWRIVSIYPGRVTLRSDDGSLIVKTLTGTTVPLVVSALRNWKPPVFHHEE